MTLNFRLLNLLGFLGCIFGLLFALYLQHYRGYEPCPFCIFQRVAMLATGLVFLAAAIHGPKVGGQWVYVFLSSMAALVGAGIAARHVWLQSLPPDQVPACGPTLDYLMDMMPLQEVVATVLKGDGNCAKIDAQWLGISLPGWTLIAFIGFVVYAVLTPVLPKILRKSA
ncbi:disulfide bond formation protein B [Solimonas sp. SE-A11]|uniref:disulfide bond formation protein B n=1 Tax=Solimonas sp. SE-A11 TaxID=3054954 RepID=UPI00259C746C|nr:disulfide bond formation protein B [Solimonas sp. SE-A11]MDM4771636.1 disulfide bond formation protein B [Solimonas sp. SE-A11]